MASKWLLERLEADRKANAAATKHAALCTIPFVVFGVILMILALSCNG